MMAETVQAPRTIKKLQVEARGLAQKNRSRLRREALDEIGSLLARQSLAE